MTTFVHEDLLVTAPLLHIDVRELDLYGDVIHYRLSGFGPGVDGIHPGGLHRQTWPNGCDEAWCPQFNPCVVPPRPGYERKRFNIALQSVQSYLKDALLIARMGIETDLSRGMLRWRLDDATKIWSDYLKDRQVEG